MVVERMTHPEARFIPGLEQAAAVLRREVGPGAVVVTLSAGDANRIGTILLEGLAGQQAGGSHE